MIPLLGTAPSPQAVLKLAKPVSSVARNAAHARADSTPRARARARRGVESVDPDGDAGHCHLAERVVTRVLLVEDSPLVASGLRATLEMDPVNVIAGSVASVGDAEQFIRNQPVDVAVVDIRLPDGTGFDLMRRLADMPEGPSYLVVSSFDLAQYVDAALRFGASGYILKTAPTEEVLAAVRAIAAGGWAFDADVVRKAGGAKQLQLSVRDRQIIAGVMAGRSNDEIGMDLNIARKTVEAYISKLFIRFGISTRVELARLAEREQWLERPTSED